MHVMKVMNFQYYLWLDLRQLLFHLHQLLIHLPHMVIVLFQLAMKAVDDCPQILLLVDVIFIPRFTPIEILCTVNNFWNYIESNYFQLNSMFSRIKILIRGIPFNKHLLPSLSFNRLSSHQYPRDEQLPGFMHLSPAHSIEPKFHSVPVQLPSNVLKHVSPPLLTHQHFPSLHSPLLIASSLLIANSSSRPVKKELLASWTRTVSFFN